MSLPDAFWAKTTRADCITWAGAQNSKGYGCFAIEGKSQLAHRLVWEDVNGAIPEGMQVDHLCRNRACVNPEHLELVTSRENQLRKPSALRIGGECLRGHNIASGDDIYVNPKGRKECRACRRTHRSRANSLADTG